MDIGLHLLGGDPLGFWRQPRDVQVDLLAYYRIAQRDDASRWSLLMPSRGRDLALAARLLALPKLTGGLLAYLGAKGVRWRENGSGGGLAGRLTGKARKFWLGAA